MNAKDLKYHQEWRNKNRDKVRAASKKYKENHKELTTARTVKSNRKKRSDYRKETISHYGGTPPRCACCGEKEVKFLTIDHINGGGNKDRKEKNNVAGGLCGWLVKNGFPSGFQVLCMNCNWGKYINGGKCPHKN